MKKIKLHYGYHPEYQREYNNEMILSVIEIKQQKDKHIRLSNGAWIKDAGNDKYHSEWTTEERWARAEQIEVDDVTGEELSRETLGFVLWAVDRSRGYL